MTETAAKGDVAKLKKPEMLDGVVVPATMQEALHRFFLGPEHAPRFLVAAFMISTALRFVGWRENPVDFVDAGVVVCVAVFWAFQEWWLHKHLLHAPFKWLGTDIHIGHHERAFYHVSIDSMSLVLPWFLTASLALQVVLPAHLAVTATTTYTACGLFYEFVHYLAHTAVQPKSKFLRNIKTHHMKHHLIDQRYWHTFSWIEIDSIMDTAPTSKQLQHMAAQRRAAKE